MLWPQNQEFYTVLFRNVAYGHVEGTSLAAQEIEPILVDSAGRVVTKAEMQITVSGPHAVVTGGATVYSPWIDTNGAMGLGWYVQNAGANAVSTMTYQWAAFAAGVLPNYAAAVVIGVPAGQTRYFSDPTTAAANNKPDEWNPLFCQSTRLGVHGGGAVTAVNIYLVLAVW